MSLRVQRVLAMTLACGIVMFASREEPRAGSGGCDTCIASSELSIAELSATVLLHSDGSQVDADAFVFAGAPSIALPGPINAVMLAGDRLTLSDGSNELSLTADPHSFGHVLAVPLPARRSGDYRVRFTRGQQTLEGRVVLPTFEAHIEEPRAVPPSMRWPVVVQIDVPPEAPLDLVLSGECRTADGRSFEDLRRRVVSDAPLATPAGSSRSFDLRANWAPPTHDPFTREAVRCEPKLHLTRVAPGKMPPGLHPGSRIEARVDRVYRLRAPPEH